MRTLNKALCLVLAVVMCFGLLSISANAFTDDDAIQYTTAVDVMVGIGAIDGYDDGSFKPAGAVKRSEAAKMLTYAILGPTVASKLSASASVFTDVAVSDWFAPYVAYCNSKGIITGTSATTFAPNASVTSYQLAKMILVAAGYGAKDEYEGNGWDLAVATDAFKQKVFDGTKETNFSDAATREETALYIFNGLMNINQVRYNEMFGYYGKGTSVASGKDGQTIADEIYGIKTAEGIVTVNQANSTDAFTTVFVIKDGAGDDVGAAKKYNLTTGLDLLGHYVKVYYKTEYTDATTKGVAYTASDLSTVVKVAKDITTETKIKAAFGSTLPTVASTSAAPAHTFTNYTAADGIGDTIYKAADFIAGAGTYIVYKGVLYSVLLPGTFAMDIVSNVRAATATTTGIVDFATVADITLLKTIDTTPKTYNVYDGIAKGDVVCIATTGTLTTVTKAVTATGTVSNVKQDAAGVKTLVADGTTYTKSAVYKTILGTMTDLAADFTAALLGKTCTFYMGLDGKVSAVKVDSGATDAGLFYPVAMYSKVGTSDYGAGTKTYWVQGVDMTGKEVNYQVYGDTKTADGTEYFFIDATQKAVASYAGTAISNGKLYKVATAYDSTEKASMASLTLLVNSTPATLVYAEVSDGALKATDKGIDANTFYASDVTFIFVSGSKTTLKITTATGAQTVPASTPYVYYGTRTAAGGNETVKYVVVGAAATATPVTGSIMFVPAVFNTLNAVPYTNASGVATVAYNQTVYVDGEAKVILTEDEKAGTAGAVAVGFYTYSVSATGAYTLTALTTNVSGADVVANVYGDLLTLTTKADPVTNADASSAKIVDVAFAAAYAADPTTELAQITTLSGLMADGVATDTNATVYAAWTVNAATGAVTVTNIYIVAQPSHT